MSRDSTTHTPNRMVVAVFCRISTSPTHPPAGLLLACALQLSGHRVAVVEAGPLRGRAQDWNTSADELQALVRAGVLDASELAVVAPLRFGPMACRFGPTTPEQVSLPWP